MIFNKNLAIVVPTYNRVKILKIWLEHHAQLMFLKKIQIHIQDNHSTDGTKQLIKEWKKKFKNISFETNKKNIGIKNLEKPLNRVNSRFVWMVGDTYFISNQLINKILLKIKAHLPLFFIVNLKEHIKNLKEEYMDAKLVFEKLTGILSCLSCTIYNKAKLGNIKFNYKPLSHFPHTIYVLDRLKKHNSKAYWISSSIYKLKLSYKEQKLNWANTSSVFEIGCKNWIDSINSLVGYSYQSKKKAFKLFSDITNLFSWKGGFWLRAQGLLTINKIKDYKIYLNKSVGKKYLIFYFIALLPSFPLNVLKKIYDQCLKK
jgi:glycosyltransferase involved in cell wall biosynthesis